jgi:hypothetical protein
MPQPNSPPGLYTHKTRPIAFSLVVDDFGVKYINKEDMDHLVQTIGNRYPIKVDWKAEYYLGSTIKWGYVNSFQAIRVFAVRVTPIFTSKKHALNT